MRAVTGVTLATLLAACSTAPTPLRTGTHAATGATPLPAAAEATRAIGPCSDESGWNVPAAPGRVHGNTWYVGTCGIVALLVASSDGHILVDAGTREAAAQVLANIRTLGFRVEDIRYIVNSHAHLDHSGGIAQIQRESGATVVALASALPALRTGRSVPDDPQHGALSPFEGIGASRTIADGSVLQLGPLALTAHATPGHAPGGTSWTWRSCDTAGCLDIAFVDSLTAVSAPGYRFSDTNAHPEVVPTFRATFARVATLPCDVLLTPHPQASALWSRLGSKAGRPLAEPGACADLARRAGERLDARLAEERTSP